MHLWANNGVETVGHARSSNISFDSNGIYSYNRKIGVYRNGITFIANINYSVTTSSHISMLRKACQHHSRVCLVRGVFLDQRIETAIMTTNEHVKGVLKRAKRVRSNSWDYDRVLNDLEGLDQWVQANNYEYTDAEVAERIEIVALHASLHDRMVRVRNGEFITSNNGGSHRFHVYTDEEKQILIAEWRSGKRTNLPNSVASSFVYGENNSFAGYAYYLRYLPSSNRVQSSGGAEITLDAARKFALLYNRVKWPWSVAEEQSLSLDGNFSLHWIDEHGNVKIGCHILKAEELQVISEATGITLRKVNKQPQLEIVT
jgi:hypothetical protein